MQTAFYKKSSTGASITIKIEASDYQSNVAHKLKAYSKKANIKGFRPGHVPHAVIQKIYGRAVLMEEVHALVETSMTKCLRENEIHVLGEPVPVLEKNALIDWDRACDFEFEYMIGMPGTFSCVLSKDIQVKAYKISHVSETTVDHWLTELRAVHGTALTVPKSADGDVLHGVLDYAAQGLKAHIQLHIGQITEKFRPVFFNRSPGQQITLDLKQFVQDLDKFAGVPPSMRDTMRNLHGTAVLAVEQVQRRLPATLDQVFFDKVLGPGVVKSEQEFKDVFQAQILQQKQQEADDYLAQHIQGVLLRTTKIELPEDFLKQWLQRKNSAVPKEQIALEYPQYAKALRWQLLAASLIKTYHIQVTQEEIETVVQQHLQTALESNTAATQDSPQVLTGQAMHTLVKKLLQEDGGKRYDQVRERLYSRKLIHCIQSKITVVAQEVGVEAFDQYISE